MKKFTINAHTADIRLFAQGSTLQELFMAGLEGMAEIIAPGTCKTPYQHTHKISTLSMDSTTLLIDFLSEALTQTHVNKIIFCSGKFITLSNTALDIEIYGNQVDHFDEDIKAVTYHEAEVKKNAEGIFETVIIFDI